MCETEQSEESFQPSVLKAGDIVRYYEYPGIPDDKSWLRTDTITAVVPDEYPLHFAHGCPYHPDGLMKKVPPDIVHRHNWNRAACCRLTWMTTCWLERTSSFVYWASTTWLMTERGRHAHTLWRTLLQPKSSGDTFWAKPLMVWVQSNVQMC